MIAVALAGEGAYLHRESALDLVGIVQFNPRRVYVGTNRRVRRTLPKWMQIEKRNDVPDEDLIDYKGVASTTVRRTLADMRDRMPPDRWKKMMDEAVRREFIDWQDTATLNAVSP